MAKAKEPEKSGKRLEGIQRMNKIGLTQSGMVVVEMSQKEFAALQALQQFSGAEALKTVTAPAAASAQKVYPSPTDAVSGVSGDQMTLKQAVDYCASRLVKLAPKKRTGALNVLRAMFNFQGGVSDERVEEIYQALRNKGLFVERDGKIEYP